MTSDRPTPGEPGTAAWFGDRLFAGLQAPLPHHALSRLLFHLARIRLRWVKNAQIRSFVRWKGVDLSEAAESSPEAYDCFNAFFTRALRPGARPVVSGPGEVASPVDGTVSQAGDVASGRLLQAKGRSYGLAELLGGEEERAAPFQGGRFATLYLSPRDYHRVHMPLAGELREMLHVPGRIFAVNPPTTRAVPRLFARNERVVALFDSEAGPLALVLVGAMFVAAIETAWEGLITSPSRRTVRRWDYRGRGVRLERGEEMGRFNMGSTVIVLVGPEARVEWAPEVRPGAPVRMGRLLGRLGRASGAPSREAPTSRKSPMPARSAPTSGGPRA